MSVPVPTIGAWYRLDGGESFEVVAFDTDDGTVEIQYRAVLSDDPWKISVYGSRMRNDISS